jgi:hypothetical protein
MTDKPALPIPIEKYDYVRLYLEDEIPEFGSGHRGLLVLSYGPKHVGLLLTEDGTTGTLDTPDFERRKPIRITINKRELAERILRNVKRYDRYNGRVRDALLALGLSRMELPDAPAEPGEAVEGSAPLAAPADASEKPLAGEGSGRFIQRLWMAGVNDPDRLVALVLAAWPGRTTKRSDVAYNVNALKKAGVPNIPPWPSKK